MFLIPLCGMRILAYFSGIVNAFFEKRKIIFSVKKMRLSPPRFYAVFGIDFPENPVDRSFEKCYTEREFV